MNQFTDKFKLIFIPFLLISVLTLAGYTFFHWLLCIKTNIIIWDEDVTNFFIPFILPWIPMLIWLMPRIKLLNLKNKSGKGDPLMAYLMVAWLTIGLTSIIAQEYLITASGKLTNLDNISQLNEQPPTKYYTLKHYYIDKRLARIKPVFEISGKHNEYFDMAIYVPCPIYDRNFHQPVDTVSKNNLKTSIKPVNLAGNPLIVVDGKIISKSKLALMAPQDIASVTVLKGTLAKTLYGDTAKNGVILIKLKNNALDLPNEKPMPTPIAWLAIKYKKSVSNNLSQQEKDSEYQQFAKESQNDFYLKHPENFIYLNRIGASKDLGRYKAAVSASGAPVTELIIILAPVNEPFADRNGDKLAWIFGSFSIGAALFLIGLLFKPLKEDAIKEDLAGASRKDWNVTLIWIKTLFIPRKNHYATQIIIEINLLVFITMVGSGLGFISFNANDLLNWGANYRPNTFNGEYWRLITNTFLHGGVMHLLFNMYGLFFVGILLEPVLSSGKFIIYYFATGILASITSAWWHPATVSVGASGAIFGMYGIFLALLTTNLFPKDFKKSFLINTSIFVGYNLLYGLTGGIDNAAHIGGLLSGLIIGYAVYPGLKRKLTEIDTQSLLDGLAEKQIADGQKSDQSMVDSRST